MQSTLVALSLLLAMALVITHNPIFVGFLLMLLGQFLVFPNWVPLVYLLGGIFIIHRQIMREEAFLRAHYGEAYVDYCGRVRRYI